VGHLAHTSSVASCAASTVSNRPTVVIGDGPGGSSSRRYASQRSPSAVMVPWSFPFQDPDQLRASSCRQAGALVGFGSGAFQANSKLLRQSPGVTRTYVCTMA
jgi:hypothetical protein